MMRLPVLLYHHVGPLRGGTFHNLTVSPERFEQHVRRLARLGYVGIRPADWIRWRREGTHFPERPVLITFDDGYADLAEHALPLLRRYNFGAAVFVVTTQLGGTNTWDEARGSAPHRLLTADQIRNWAASGIEFGAHGRTHSELTTLPPDRLRDEVVGSGEELGNVLGSRVVSFAYPYGAGNKDVVDCVRGAFDCAFTADEAVAGINDFETDPHLLRRTVVQSGDSALDVECRARWGFSPKQRLRDRIRLRTRLRNARHTLFCA
jgi:peptidoglycan/xylan/chitin deacetylase (PgdA/CDA1 family)